MKAFFRKFALITMFLACLTLTATSAVALEGSTTMTVVNVTSWSGALGGYEDISVWDETAYIYDTIATSHGQWWKIRGGNFNYPTYPHTQITGYVWLVKSSDGNKTFSAKWWDFIFNNSTLSHLGWENAPEAWVGLMTSSLCEPQNNECKAKQRSNLIFAKQTR